MKLLPTDPSDYEYGEDSPILFPPGKTPKYLYITFSDIIPKPPLPYDGPINGTYKLTQDPYPWDSWSLYDEHHTISLRLAETMTFVSMEIDEGYGCFWSGYVPIGNLHYPSLYTESTGTVWYGGQCVIWWLEPITGNSLSDILDIMTITPTEKIVGTVYPDGDDHLIYLIIEREPDNPAGKFCKTASSRLRVKAQLTS